MKPMLKTAFFSLVNDLLARGIMPELKAYAFKYYGSLVWMEGDNTRLEHLYSAGDRKSETASIFRKRFKKWFDEIIAAYHAAAAEKLTDGQQVLDGDIVRTVTGFRTGSLGFMPDGSRRSGTCPRTGVIVLDGKIEVMAGAVKPFTHSDAIIADAHAEALKMNDAYNTLYVYSPGDAARDVWELMTVVEREVAVEICHANALIEDATFEENLAFLASPEMADIWHEHSDTLRARILNATHDAALEVNKLVDEAVAFGTYSTSPNLTHFGVRNAINRIRENLLSLNRYPARFIVKMMMSVRRLAKLSNEAAQENYRQMLSRPAVDGIDSDIPF